MPMQIGLGLIGLCLSPSAAVALAVKAEESLFDSVWVAEDAWYTGRDAVSLLGAIAYATRRVELGTAILPVHHARHLQLLAATVATLDDLSNGRLRVGLGVGARWPSYPDHAKPIGLMREAVTGLRALLAGDRFELAGKELRLQLDDGPLCWPPPVATRSVVPLLVAARGPKMTALAVEIGDGLVLPLHTPPAEINRVSRVSKALLTQADRPRRLPGAVELVANVHLFVSEDGQFDDRLRAQIAGVVAAMPEDARLDGASPAEHATVRAAVAAGGRWSAAGLVTSAMVEALCVVGTPSECARQLLAYETAGLDTAILYPLGGNPELSLAIPAIFKEMRT